jgi:hypothetical protein
VAKSPTISPDIQLKDDLKPADGYKSDFADNNVDVPTDPLTA